MAPNWENPRVGRGRRVEIKPSTGEFTRYVPGSEEGHRQGLEILGVWVDDVTEEEAMGRLEAFIESRTPLQVVTVNPEFVMAAQQDAEFRAILNSAALALPDGFGLLLLSGLLGHRLRERVAGSDVVPRLCELAARRGYRVFFLGAAPGVAEEAARRLQARYPGLIVAGTHAGSPAPADEPGIVSRIILAQPHLLFVAYGAPQQDKWIARNLQRLGVPLVMGVGGAFDFIAGRAVRAPRWVRRLGLEWLHRLARQPWRWRRVMTAVPLFTWHVIRYRLSGSK